MRDALEVLVSPELLHAAAHFFRSSLKPPAAFEYGFNRGNKFAANSPLGNEAPHAYLF